MTRDFVRTCQTPILILPDDVPAHPYEAAMESALLAPRADVSLYPWRQPKDRIPSAVRHVRTFLRAHGSETAAGSRPLLEPPGTPGAPPRVCAPHGVEGKPSIGC